MEDMYISVMSFSKGIDVRVRNISRGRDNERIENALYSKSEKHSVNESCTYVHVFLH